MEYKKLKVVELFAGVGGFRVGLEKSEGFEIVWSNQWEPSTKTQHASLVYEKVFGKDNHSNKDIEKVLVKDIPDCDVLVGGFPCQDYSVANSLKRSGGIEGKKGVLWWSIDKILREKKKKPKYLILENVDRLLKSPVSQRGRDFAIMLKCFQQNDYAIEWRVINAADYGFPQRRRRVFIIGYHKNTKQYKTLKKNPLDWIKENGVLANAFPISNCENFVTENINELDLVQITKSFNLNSKKSTFENTGVFIDGKFITCVSRPLYGGKRILLKDVLEGKVCPSFYIEDEDIHKWKYLKGGKKESRKTKEGFQYNFSEGSMTFPDTLNKPSRTIITSEGGKSPSRFKHAIEDAKGIRRLTPVELERLNGFEDNHSMLEGITDVKRAFFMGNALVVGVVEEIGKALKF